MKILKLHLGGDKMRDMKYDKTVLLVAILALLVIPIGVYASHEQVETPIAEEEEPCKFTANIDKTPRRFTERIQVFGFVHPNCETYELYDSYKVHVKVVDMEGNLVKDDWKPQARQAEKVNPSLYEFDAIIQEVGIRLAWDSMNKMNHTVYPGMFYTTIPQLNSVHFNEYEVYAVEVSYGDMTISNAFIIVN